MAEQTQDDRAHNDQAVSDAALIDRHLSFGWWSLWAFLTLGIVLEAMHAFKIGWYLSVGNETRRLMWTLAHSHGALIALVHFAFAQTVHLRKTLHVRPRRMASYCLMGASVLLPGSFFLAGTFIYDGDPGVGVFLVPVGAGLLFIAVLLSARHVRG
ncbi:MAG: hypothetical protein ACI9EF_001738 [Pseudohongiellaceae bacterium]|jgi:hypothetical protein